MAPNHLPRAEATPARRHDGTGTISRRGGSGQTRAQAGSITFCERIRRPTDPRSAVSARPSAAETIAQPSPVGSSSTQERVEGSDRFRARDCRVERITHRGWQSRSAWRWRRGALLPPRPSQSAAPPTGSARRSGRNGAMATADFDTRTGILVLGIVKPRTGTCVPHGCWRSANGPRGTDAGGRVVLSARVSTRRLEKLVQLLGNTGLSTSQATTGHEDGQGPRRPGRAFPHPIPGRCQPVTLRGGRRVPTCSC